MRECTIERTSSWQRTSSWLIQLVRFRRHDEIVEISSAHAQLAAQLARGHDATAGLIIRAGGRVVAAVLIRQRGVRLNLREAPGKGVPARLRKLVAPTKSVKSWASFAYVTSENLEAAWELLAMVSATDS